MDQLALMIFIGLLGVLIGLILGRISQRGP
jgi:hypothetical protein